MPSKQKGFVEIDSDECKGCALCVDTCPPACLHLSANLSHFGVHAAEYDGEGCTGCGICFYCCPEPGAISVYREEKKAVNEPSPVAEDEKHAGAL